VSEPIVPRSDIVGIDRQVPLLDGSSCPYIFLDNAASAPALRGVQEKVDEFLTWYSSIHRGTGFKSLVATEAYEKAREIVAEFVGADLEKQSVIFVKNTTEAINKLAYRMELQPDDVVITTVMEHHSNDLPWRPKAQVDYVGIKEDGTLDIEDLEAKLKAYDGRVKLVATTGASNVSGYVTPTGRMAELAHEHGAKILVDCAQLAPHRQVDMGPMDSPQHLDFVAISAHKMYAPYGSGALVGPREFFDRGVPEYMGGGTIEIVTLDEVYWAGTPERDEAGSPNVVGAIALAAAIRILMDIGMEAVADHEAELTRYALEKLNQIEGVTIYGSSDPDRLDDRLGVIAFQIDGVHHGKAAAILGFEGGIGVRNGCFCAHPYILRLLDIKGQVYEGFKERVLNHDRSDMPGLIRISFGCYNTEEDVDALVTMVKRIVDGDYIGDYTVDKSNGFYWPRQFDQAVIEDSFQL
jgi:selenocysteine lyase/cysteine desulfurase